MRLWVRPGVKFMLSLRFSRTVASAPDTTQCDGALPSQDPYRRLIRFQGQRNVNKKRKLFPGHAPASLSSLALPQVKDISTSWSRNVNLVPFRLRGHRNVPLAQRH